MKLHAAPLTEHKMSKKVCPLCKREVDENIIILHTIKDKMIIDAVKQKNPHWVEDDGSCPRCIEYYKIFESN